LGHRSASGWIVDNQAPLQVKPDTFYQVLVAVNGTTVTVQVANKSLTHTFPARVVNGENVGLNKGLVGMGSDNSRGVFDNVIVQVLPPAVTFDSTEDFNDGVADLFTGDQAGTWIATGGRYDSTAPSGVTSIDTVDYGLGHGLQPNSYLEIQATLKTSGIGGIVFDEYAANDFKFVALDVAAQKVLVGHVDPRRGWVIESSFPKTLLANTDYAVQLVFKGTSVSVTVGGSFIVSQAFNATVVDGSVGVLSRSGATSFDTYRIRTNDPAFATAPLAAAAAPAASFSTASSEPVSSQLYDPLDVDRDGYVSPIDAVLIINYLNSHHGGGAQAALSDSVRTETLDVDGDQAVSPIDAVLVINHLNATRPAEAEGEAADAYFDDVDQSREAEDDFWMLLAIDTAAQRNKRR
jgi:hypothetical protein